MCSTQFKRFLPALGFLLLAAMPPNARSQTAPQPLWLTPSAWQLTPTGKFEAWTDRRDLLVLYHPWEVSDKGSAVTAEQTVTIPDGWETPVHLFFYLSDDYDGSTEPVNAEWLGQINLPGHRFKEVLVDGATVWRQDVADSADISAPTRFVVDLPDTVKPGSTIRLAFRLADEAGSMERLPGDHRYIGTTDNITEDDPWKFMTHTYVGDVTLAPASVGAVSPRSMPSVDLARAEHGDKWPLPPVSAEMEFPVRLAVRHVPTANVPFVVQCGVPFPAGALPDPANIRLTAVDGTPIPVAAQIMNTWPRGDVRMAAITTILPARCREVILNVDGASPEPPAGGVQISFSEPGVGTVAASLVNGENRVDNITGEYIINGEKAGMHLETVETLEESPLHREVEARGRIKSDSSDFGRFVFRVTTFAGQPYVRIFHRIFNDHPETLEVTHVALQFPQQGAHAPETKSGPVTRVFQTGPETWMIARNPDGTEPHEGKAVSWYQLLFPTGEASLSSVVRDFAAQHPIANGFDEGALLIELFAPTDEEPAYTPHEGEAKRHEIWLALWDESTPPDLREAGATWMADPPGLFDAAYFCATGAFGMAAPHDDTRFPELTAFMHQTYGDIPASMFYSTGIRHWGDLPYNEAEGTWRNGYYDAQQGFFSEYLMTGDARWFDHLEASVRHIMDVDICHASAEHPDWTGAIHGLYSKDHSTGDPWNPTQRTKGTLNYWRLTGDRDAREAALGVADSAVACNRAMGSVSVRDHAGVLYCLVAAYDETHDPKYLEAARQLAHDAMKRIDPRRGCYAEIHGNYSYRGNVPWMVAQLMEPMYDYYRASGDVDAAVAVVGMAESILAENRTRGVDGDVFGYSHNPHFKKNSGYHILIAPAILYARELTGDKEFLRQARAMYGQTIAEGTVNSVMNCYWNTHTLLYFLDHYANVETE